MLRPHNFADLRQNLADGRSVTTLNNMVTRTRVLLNCCVKSGYIDSQEMTQAWSDSFNKPSAREQRAHKQFRGAKFIEAADIHSTVLEIRSGR